MTELYNNVENNIITLFDYFTCLFHLLLKNITNNKTIFIDTIFSDYQETKIGSYNNTVILKNNLIYENLSLEEYIKKYSLYLKKIK
jgi:hypothetical protein